MINIDDEILKCEKALIICKKNKEIGDKFKYCRPDIYYNLKNFFDNTCDMLKGDIKDINLELKLAKNNSKLSFILGGINFVVTAVNFAFQNNILGGIFAGAGVGFVGMAIVGLKKFKKNKKQIREYDTILDILNEEKQLMDNKLNILEKVRDKVENAKEDFSTISNIKTGLIQIKEGTKPCDELEIISNRKKYQKVIEDGVDNELEKSVDKYFDSEEKEKMAKFSNFDKLSNIEIMVEY